MKPLTGVLLLALIVAILFGVYQHRLQARVMGLLPLGVAAERIEYRSARVMGLGPGGNEYGIVVFTMDDGAADSLARDGLSYLRSRPVGTPRPLSKEESDRHLRRLYADWTATVAASASPDGTGAPAALELLDDEAFVDGVRPEVIAEARRLLSTPGAYYARARSNRIAIVAPASRKVIVAWAS